VRAGRRLGYDCDKLNRMVVQIHDRMPLGRHPLDLPRLCVLLPNPAIRQRRYDEIASQRLAIIRFARHVGFSLVEIGQLLDGTPVRPPSGRWRQMAHERMTRLDDAIRHASALKQMLRETLSEQCPRLVERGSALHLQDSCGLDRRTATDVG
jgi:DNA-binding transcriptional MerR regulator